MCRTLIHIDVFTPGNEEGTRSLILYPAVELLDSLHLVMAYLLPRDHR